MSNNNNKKHFSIKTKITFSIVLFVLVSLGLVFIGSFLNSKRINRDNLRSDLLNTVGIASLQVDGDKHSSLLTISDEGSSSYKDIVKVLKNIQKNTDDIHYIYTMRKNDNGDIIFIVDPDDSDPNNISHIGTVYNDASSFLRDNFSLFKKPAVEKDFYTDQWGTWISGYAPIYKENGEIDGILGIDIKAGDILLQENNMMISYILIFIFAGFLSIIFGIFLSKKLMKLINSLASNLENKENIDISDASNDELGNLAKVIQTTLNDDKSIVLKADEKQKEAEDVASEKIKTIERMNKLMVGRELEMIKLKEELKSLKSKQTDSV